ncbi:MAG: hypothetical protein ABFD92_17185 [Planctomycetaceae bacterium]|nr:hypothetical protein [Planctomycetaceae bacterium]
MARVVQRRKAPPYALIVFVFLFLVASALAVHQYIQRDEADKKTRKAEQDNEAWISKAERDKPRIVDMVTTYQNDKQNQRVPRTVTDQMQSQIRELVARINGIAGDNADTAISAVDSFYKQIGSQRGLLTEAADLLTQRDNADKLVKEMQGTVSKVNIELTGARKYATEISDKYKENLASRDAQIIELREQMTALGAEKDKILELAKKENADKLVEKTEAIKQTTEQMHGVNKSAREWKRKFEEVREKIAQKTKRIETATAPDGKILRLADEGGQFAYINLGSRDGVEVGHIFSVFPQSGIPKLGDNPEEVQKASLTVVSVGDEVCRCQVTDLKKKDNPVIANDLIVNVAFDSIRKWKFVVEGLFNLHGPDTGASEQGNVEVTLLLRRLGAEVTDVLDVDVDFLVLGVEPPAPKRPEDEAPPQVWEAYKQADKVRKRHAEMRKAASELRIPIINTNTFLAMTGYTPIKALKEVPPR